MEIERFHVPSADHRSAIEEMLCMICRRVLVNPKRCPCQHVFCFQCIDNHLKHSSVCPVDPSVPLDSSSLRASSMHTNFVNILNIHCINHKSMTPTLNGDKSQLSSSSLPPSSRLRKCRRVVKKTCDWVGFVKDVKEHEAICKFRKIQCPLCFEYVLSQHFDVSHPLVCPNVLVRCDVCNGVDIPRCKMDHHRAHDCPIMTVICPYDCQCKNIRRKDLKQHMTKCPHRMVKCKFTHVGCTYQGQAQYIEQHMVAHVAEHMALMSVALVDLQQKHVDLQQKHVKLSRDYEDLRTDHIELKAVVEQMTGSSRGPSSVRDRSPTPIRPPQNHREHHGKTQHESMTTSDKRIDGISKMVNDKQQYLINLDDDDDVEADKDYHGG